MFIYNKSEIIYVEDLYHIKLATRAVISVLKYNVGKKVQFK